MQSTIRERPHTLVSNVQKHGHTDKDADLEARVLCEYSIPENKHLVHWKFTAKEKAEPSTKEQQDVQHVLDSRTYQSTAPTMLALMAFVDPYIPKS